MQLVAAWPRTERIKNRHTIPIRVLIWRRSHENEVQCHFDSFWWNVLQEDEWWIINDAKEKHVQYVEERVNNWRWPFDELSHAEQFPVHAYIFSEWGVQASFHSRRWRGFFLLVKRKLIVWDLLSKLLHDFMKVNILHLPLLSRLLSPAALPTHRSSRSRWWWSTKLLNATANFREAFNNELSFMLHSLDEASSSLLEPVVREVAADKM